jgi:hypothetical protein
MRPQLAGAGVNCEALRIAMTIAPNLGSCLFPLAEWIAGRSMPIRINANDRPDMALEILRLVPMLEIVSNAHENSSVTRLDDATAEVCLRSAGAVRAKYRTYLLKPQLLLDQPRPRYDGPTAPVDRFDVAEIDRLVSWVGAVERDIEQPRLATSDREHVGDAFDRLRHTAVSRHNPHPPRPFSNQHPPMGQEGQAPWLLQSSCHGLHANLAGRGLHHLLRVSTYASSRDCHNRH